MQLLHITNDHHEERVSFWVKGGVEIAACPVSGLIEIQYGPARDMTWLAIEHQTLHVRQYQWC